MKPDGIIFERPEPRGIEIGTCDRITAIFGVRGTGKSTLAMMDSLDFQRETDAFVIGHSPGARVPFGTLPDGRRVDIKWHDNLRSLERGLQRYPRSFHFVVDPDMPPEDVIEYGRALARGIRKKAIEDAGHKYVPNRPVPKGVKARPVLIVIDEGTAVKEHLTATEKKELKVFLTGARHEHVALTWLIQSPTMRNWILSEQSCRHFAFRVNHEWSLNCMRAGGIPMDDIKVIQKLPNFEYKYFDLSKPRANDTGA